MAVSKSKIDDCTDNDVFDVKAVISEADGMILFFTLSNAHEIYELDY